tara:strand:- start:21907 stop:23763 length:1857 start_codon:yes stop_codon:yes gene_type:complete
MEERHIKLMVQEGLLSSLFGGLAKLIGATLGNAKAFARSNDEAVASAAAAKADGIRGFLQVVNEKYGKSLEQPFDLPPTDLIPENIMGDDVISMMIYSQECMKNYKKAWGSVASKLNGFGFFDNEAKLFEAMFQLIMIEKREASSRWQELETAGLTLKDVSPSLYDENYIQKTQNSSIELQTLVADYLSFYGALCRALSFVPDCGAMANKIDNMFRDDGWLNFHKGDAAGARIEELAGFNHDIWQALFTIDEEFNTQVWAVLENIEWDDKLQKSFDENFLGYQDGMTHAGVLDDLSDFSYSMSGLFDTLQYVIEAAEEYSKLEDEIVDTKLLLIDAEESVAQDKLAQEESESNEERVEQLQEELDGLAEEIDGWKGSYSRYLSESKGSKMRKLKNILFEKAQPSKGGTHTFHGNLWPPEKVGLPGPEFDDEVAVTEDDLNDAEQWLKDWEPDTIVAYSRGSAVLHKLAAERDVQLPKITYIAPAAKRDKWGTKGISAPSVSGTAVASSGDGAVPVKQVCQIAQEAGVELRVVPGKFKSDDWESEGRKNHIRVLKHKDSPSSAGKAMDLSSCLSSDLPDWGSGIADKETLEKQIQISNELTGLEEQTLRTIIRRIILES